MDKAKVTGIFKNYKKHFAFITTLVVGFVIAVILVNAFLELRDELSEKDMAPFDDSIANMVEDIRSEPLTDFFKFISSLGDQEFYFVALPVLAFIIYKSYGNFTHAIQSAVVLGVAALMYTLLKKIIERPRPQGYHLVEVSASSFPSGHTVTSMAFYGFLIYIFWRSELRKWIKILITVVLVLIILGIAFSRVYLGVHYATDVIAGLVTGGFFLLVFVLTFFTQRYFNNH